VAGCAAILLCKHWKISHVATGASATLAHFVNSVATSAITRNKREQRILCTYMEQEKGENRILGEEDKKKKIGERPEEIREQQVATFSCKSILVRWSL
jgi:hypothetical protein